MRALCVCVSLLFTCSMERVVFKMAVDAAAPYQVAQIFLFVPYVALHLFACFAFMIIAAIASCCEKHEERPRIGNLRGNNDSSGCCLDEEVAWQSMASIATLDILHLTLLFASAARTPGLLTIVLIYLARVVASNQTIDHDSTRAGHFSLFDSQQQHEEDGAELMTGETERDSRHVMMMRRRRRRLSSFTLNQKHLFVLNAIVCIMTFLPRAIGSVRHSSTDSYNQLFASCIYFFSFLPLHASTVLKERSLVSISRSLSRLQLNRNLALWQLALATMLFPWIYVLLTRLNAANEKVPSLAVTICAAWRSVFGLGTINWTNLTGLQHQAPLLFLAQLMLGSSAEFFQTLALKCDCSPLNDATISAGSLLLAALLLPLCSHSIPPVTDTLAAFFLCLRFALEAAATYL
mmetsp:Transcript_18013/g.27130  ORF Transcript_18013/g.27130 Transcript_18013/m.27130 type:complete len:406 (+) Transcript_18013:70-1287(+)